MYHQASAIRAYKKKSHFLHYTFCMSTPCIVYMYVCILSLLLLFFWVAKAAVTCCRLHMAATAHLYWQHDLYIYIYAYIHIFKYVGLYTITLGSLLFFAVVLFVIVTFSHLCFVICHYNVCTPYYYSNDFLLSATALQFTVFMLACNLINFQALACIYIHKYVCKCECKCWNLYSYINVCMCVLLLVNC